MYKGQGHLKYNRWRAIFLKRLPGIFLISSCEGPNPADLNDRKSGFFLPEVSGELCFF